LVSSMVFRHFVRSLALLLWFLTTPFARSSVTHSNHRSFYISARLWPQDSNSCHVQLPYPSLWHAQAMGNFCHDSYTHFHKNSVSFVILSHPSSSTRPQTFLKSIPSKNLSRQSCLWSGPCFTTKSSIQNKTGFSR
jgi:hypothetical protein